MALAIIALILLAGVVYQMAGRVRDDRRFPAPGRLVDAGGQHLHVVCRGSGTPTVVFEAGIAASSVSWVRVQEAVAPFATTCSYDRAGFGWSPASPGPRTFARTVETFEALLAKIDCEKPYILVGHSFGTYVCLEYAARHRQNVVGVVLVDPPSDWTSLDRRQRHLLRGGIVMSHLGGLLARIGVVRGSLALLTGGSPSSARHFVKVFGPTTAGTLKRLVGEVRKLPTELHRVVAALWSQPKCFASMADHLRMLPDAIASADRIRTLGDVPIIVLSSGDQPPAILDAHRALADRSSRGRVVVASRSGHWIPYDEPELIVDAVRELARP